MARLSSYERKQLELKEKFVALWVTGAGVTRGNAAECNRVLRTDFDFCDEDIKRLITEEGIVVPPCKPEAVEAPLPAVAVAPVLAAEILESANVPVLAALQHEQELAWRDEKLAAAELDDEKRDWCKKYKDLESTIDSIAMGVTKASAAQARIINMVTDRCFGKIKEDAEDKVLSGVMLLPMIGSGASAQICPRCGYTHEDEANG